MKRRIFGSSIALALMASWANIASAQPARGTPEEAKALVEAAVLHVKKVGSAQAFQDFQADKATWFKKDLYVFAYDMKGVCLALGKV